MSGKEKYAATPWQGQTIRDTLVFIDRSTTGAVVFLDVDGRVVGLVTDGDIRRALIRGADLDEPINKVWSATPLTTSANCSVTKRFELLKTRNLRHLILLDSEGRFERMETFQEVEAQFEINPRRCPVILMAGGRGKRLMPLTADRPKPMLDISGRPLLQWTLEKLIDQGFEDFFISVHYRKEQIVDFFGDGSQFDVSIKYLVEDYPNGTGGCLRLLPQIENKFIIVMNGDIITDLDMRSLLSFHDTQNFKATMVVHPILHQIEYGVVRSDGTRFLRLDEKPTEHLLINAGIYALHTSILESLPKKDQFDMPELFTKMAANKHMCGVFECNTQWIDIGTPTQLEAAKRSTAQNA